MKHFLASATGAVGGFFRGPVQQRIANIVKLLLLLLLIVVLLLLSLSLLHLVLLLLQQVFVPRVFAGFLKAIG